VLNKILCHEGVWERGSITPRFLNLSNKWRGLVYVTLRSLCALVKYVWQPMNMWCLSVKGQTETFLDRFRHKHNAHNFP